MATIITIAFLKGQIGMINRNHRGLHSYRLSMYSNLTVKARGGADMEKGLLQRVMRKMFD